MLFNKSIKKLILASLLIIIPAQTMTISWPPFSSVQQGASQLFSNMTKTMEKNKIIAAAVIGGCIAIYLGKIYFNRKKAAIRVRERVAFVGRAQLIVESIRQSRDRNNQQGGVNEEINNEVDRRCFICLCNENESDETLLQEIPCLGQDHPGRVHQSCLNQARGQRQRCPICRHEGEAAVERRTGREEMGNDNFSTWIGRMQNQGGAAAERRIVENAMLINVRERLQNAYQSGNVEASLIEQLQNLIGEGNQVNFHELRVVNGRILNP
ncbi:MAG: hypothetical protein WCD44_02955 [Candidatus Babeliales bacterium]